MENNDGSRKWYKKKRYVIPLGVIGLAFISSLGGNSYTLPAAQPAVQGTSIEQTTTAPTDTSSLAPTENIQTQVVNPLPPAQNSQPVTKEPELSNDNYYNNVNGNEVHSPAYTSDNSIPSGATARCGDGTYSFSQNHRGTCSHHGGVAEWY